MRRKFGMMQLYQKSKRTGLSPDEILALIKECVEFPYFQCELGMFMQGDGVPRVVH